MELKCNKCKIELKEDENGMLICTECKAQYYEFRGKLKQLTEFSTQAIDRNAR
jgi:uncharacterized Zn ribbon protein